MRRDQTITLSVVLALTVAVLGAKAWTKGGGRAVATPTAASLLSEGRPVVLFFNGVYGRCEPERREFESAERSFADVPDDLLAHFVVYRVNVEQPSELVHEYHVSFPPAVILLDADGDEVYRQEWGVYRETLVEQMKALLAEGDGGT
jgi:hypothetical protein